MGISQFRSPLLIWVVFEIVYLAHRVRVHSIRSNEIARVYSTNITECDGAVLDNRQEWAPCAIRQAVSVQDWPERGFGNILDDANFIYLGFRFSRWPSAMWLKNISGPDFKVTSVYGPFRQLMASCIAMVKLLGLTVVRSSGTRFNNQNIQDVNLVP